MSGAPPESDDAFVRVVRITVGRRQVDALAGDAGRRAKRAALEQAVMTSAWSSARPGDAAADWLRVVHPIDPPLEALAPDRQLLVEELDRHSEDLRKVEQAAGADSVDALLVLLDLLEGEAEVLAEFFLAHTEQHAA